MLIVTADDYGMSRLATDRILETFRADRITSASAMTFMEDSERAAALAMKNGLEVGLHLNLTQPFTGRDVPTPLREAIRRTANYLTRKVASYLFNPLIAAPVAALVVAQEQEFMRLYGRPPVYYNGHHHMHLCANVRVSALIPAGSRVRGTFTFERGERGTVNVLYRRWLQRRIEKRFTTPDGLFNIVPIEDAQRLAGVMQRAARHTIELEVHPQLTAEREFLLSDDYWALINPVRRGAFRDLVA